MTLVSEVLFDACLGGAVVEFEFDDETGVVSTVSWAVETGVLTIPDPKVVAIAGDAGSAPAVGVRLSKHPKGGWYYVGADGVGIGWQDAPHLGAGGWRRVDRATRRAWAQALVETAGAATP